MRATIGLQLHRICRPVEVVYKRGVPFKFGDAAKAVLAAIWGWDRIDIDAVVRVGDRNPTRIGRELDVAAALEAHLRWREDLSQLYRVQNQPLAVCTAVLVATSEADGNPHAIRALRAVASTAARAGQDCHRLDGHVLQVPHTQRVILGSSDHLGLHRVRSEAPELVEVPLHVAGGRGLEGQAQLVDLVAHGTNEQILAITVEGQGRSWRTLEGVRFIKLLVVHFCYRPLEPC